MNNFEPTSKEQVKQFFDTLRSKSMEEIVSLFGAPARDLGTFQRERIHWDGGFELVNYRRALGFLGAGRTAHILWIYERSDGELEFLYTVDLEADPCAKEDDSNHFAEQTLKPTATARLARTRFGFEFVSVGFWLALPVAVAQLFRSAKRE